MTAKPKPTKQDKPTKKRAKSDYTNLEAECKELTSRVVRLRDGKCVCCGSTEQLTNGHYVSCLKARLRYDLRNCNCQCWKCNVRHRQWPSFYASAMYRIYGQKTMDELDKLANIPAWKWSYADLLKIRDDLLEMYDGRRIPD